MSSGFSSLSGSVPALSERQLKGRSMERASMEFRSVEMSCLKHIYVTFLTSTFHIYMFTEEDAVIDPDYASKT